MFTAICSSTFAYTLAVIYFFLDLTKSVLIPTFCILTITFFVVAVRRPLHFIYLYISLMQY